MTDTRPTTEKQRTAIYNMSSALEWEVKVPETLMESRELISKMATEIQNRLSATGKIRQVDFDDAGHDSLMNEGMMYGY